LKKKRFRAFNPLIPLIALIAILILNLLLADRVEDKLMKNLTVENLKSFSADKLQKLKLQVDESSAVFDPWLNGFPYRKPITISNSGSALTDYQVLVTTDTASLISAGKMRTNCWDIRFTDSDGATQLNYWVESDCNSTSTKVWVKVPSIPVGSKTIYVYYGNPNAISASNANNVFLLFYDFSGTSIPPPRYYIN
jgi:hypothetical protein